MKTNELIPLDPKDKDICCNECANQIRETKVKWHCKVDGQKHGEGWCCKDNFCPRAKDIVWANGNWFRKGPDKFDFTKEQKERLTKEMIEEFDMRPSIARQITEELCYHIMLEEERLENERSHSDDSEGGK